MYMRYVYHLMLDRINPAIHNQLREDPAVLKICVDDQTKFRHGNRVPDLQVNGAWLSDRTEQNNYPVPTAANAVIVRSDWPDLAWLLLQTQDLPT